MPEKLAGVTSRAVHDATGDDWSGWLARLDEHGAADLEHPAIVALLADAGVENPWWQQQIAVGYEQSRGLREVGETRDAGYQVGVQRTIHAMQADIWEFLVSGEGREIWLGRTEAFELEPGVAYETEDGIVGEVRTLAPGERLRVTWQPPDWAGPSTLQLTLSCPRNTPDRTVVRLHHEKLADGTVRETMRERWRGVLDEVEAAFNDDT